jgi:hypothetical protein
MEAPETPQAEAATQVYRAVNLARRVAVAASKSLAQTAVVVQELAVSQKYGVVAARQVQVLASLTALAHYQTALLAYKVARAHPTTQQVVTRSLLVVVVALVLAVEMTAATYGFLVVKVVMKSQPLTMAVTSH